MSTSDSPLPPPREEATLQLVQDPQGGVLITSPRTGGPVDVNDWITGRGAIPNAEVWSVVREPLGTCWAHGPTVADARGQFSLPAQFGEARHFDFKFEIWALVNPEPGIRKDEIRCDHPASARSPAVFVKRKPAPQSVAVLRPRAADPR
jgi:hypothetical protein